ncbi:MAG: hypothetical protein G01um101418_904 [Parcubacteria group bacterium Gr01-1014_18]|nr:MAG: hypothetical protein Greene041636_883 [Parcubacteria group bacterium Greene0416_36]TSC79740.1 MAG: hypothetical protein G01um101418_904 [Parcubacteria group bacterium Gr01-1014_18]TSC97924.1 MAG: hypothetical protein Greene101420_959 [Parcubacteria group bacterium Greene1014_20]TSD06582.1 MAG: hypothetical protein Greene07142_791 [Parcubacteria group bacterium Greene0714_2]
MENKISIGRASELLGVSKDTLRRWDKAKKLESFPRTEIVKHRYYKREDVDELIKKANIFKLGWSWSSDEKGFEPYSGYYCSDFSIFNARLQRFGNELSHLQGLESIYPLITAMVGEIGNNSFDHNIGNWADIPGIFFAYDLSRKTIVLADRGQGILKTLKRVKPELETPSQALYVAFTEIVTGRAPEQRGNGLKFVRRNIEKSGVKLFFQTGNAQLRLSERKKDLNIEEVSDFIRGCIAKIEF